MPNASFFRNLPWDITVCNEDGIILDLTYAASKTFQNDVDRPLSQNGRCLIGTNVLSCHPEPARSKLDTILRNKTTRIYTIEKQGIKRFIYQTPWYKDGNCGGYTELSFELPENIPHFVRD